MSESNSSYTISDFLNKHRIVRPKKDCEDFEKKMEEYEAKRKCHTHTCYGGPNGKNGSYLIEEHEFDTFFKLYDKAIMNGEILYITERQSDLEQTCMVIDLDERYTTDVTKRLHTTKHIKEIVGLYMEEICACFDIEKDDERLTAFVFEKPDIVKTDDVVKDGIHIIFPHIISEQWERKYIRNNILKKIPKVVEDLPLTEKPHKFVDDRVIHINNWYLYGSSKGDNDYYNMTHIFNSELNELDVDNFSFGMSPAKYFSLRVASNREPLITRESVVPNVLKKKKISKAKSGKKKNIKNYDLEELAEIVDILSMERCESYPLWIQIGWALHNINPSDPKLLELWDEFSKKSTKYKEGVCAEEWSKMKDEGLGIGTLYYFAKCDNETKYNEIRRTSLKTYIDKSIESKTDYDLAKVLHEMYKFQFVCASGRRGGLWYQFNGQRWEVMETDVEIYEKISVNMCDEYCRRLSVCNIEAVDENSTEEEREAAEKKGKKMMDVIYKLKTTSSKKNIMDECKKLFYDKKFLNELDKNPYLIGFENGIYDLKLGEFRDGRPEDYVSMTTGIDYIQFDEEDENWEELNVFLSSIFPEEVIKTYVMTFFATCLQGINKEEKFRIWIGTGSNGKSKLEELFVSAFGEYCMKFPITLLTGKRPQSNQCSPEVVKAKGKRFCYFEEPNQGEKVNAGRLKEYTGGDKIEGRGLHQAPIEFKPQFKLVLLCNDLPEVPPTDQGIWRRLEVVEFRSKFCDNPQKDNEFKIDRDISEKIPRWKELFMGMLIDVYYRNYVTYGFDVPNEVMKYTVEYQRQCDMYSDFMIDAIEEVKEGEGSIDIGELHDEFKEWYEEYYSDSKSVPSKRDFKKYLIKKFGDSKVTKKDLLTFRFKSTYQKHTHSNSLSLIEAM